MNKKYDPANASLAALVCRALKLRRVCAGCLILSLLLCTLVFVPKRNEKIRAFENTDPAKAAERWKNALSAEQLAYAENALAEKKLVGETDAYLNESIAMNVDPCRINTCTLYYTVQDQNNTPNNIVQAYVNKCGAGGLLNALAREMKWELSGSRYTEILTAARTDNTHFYVTVFHLNEDELNRTAEGLKKAIAALQPSVEEEQADAFTLTLTDDVRGIKSNASLSSNQYSARSRQTSYINLYNAMLKIMLDVPAQNNYFWYEAGQREGKDYSANYVNTADYAAAPPKSLVFYYAVAAAAGIALALSVCVLSLLFGNTLAQPSELFELLGTCGGNTIRRIKRASDTELWAAKLTALCRAKDIAELSLLCTRLGSGGDAAVSAKQLTEILNKNGIAVRLLTGIDAASVETLSACRNAVVLEDCSLSRCPDIAACRALLDTCGAKLLASAAVL